MIFLWEGGGGEGVRFAVGMGDALFGGNRSFGKRVVMGRRLLICRSIYSKGFWGGRWVGLGGLSSEEMMTPARTHWGMGG